MSKLTTFDPIFQLNHSAMKLHYALIRPNVIGCTLPNVKYFQFNLQPLSSKSLWRIPAQRAVQNPVIHRDWDLKSKTYLFFYMDFERHVNLFYNYEKLMLFLEFHIFYWDIDRCDFLLVRVKISFITLSTLVTFPEKYANILI